MSRFRFRLETLLKVRIQQRDVRREALAKALRAEEIIDERIEDTENEIAAERSRQRDGLEAGTKIDLDRLLNRGRRGLTLKADLSDLQKQRVQILAERDRRQDLLVEADRDVKVLEKLKEKLAAKHQLELEKEEAKQLDAIAERLHQTRKRVMS